ncbi:hypothetical protein H490_0111015 [Leucobacter sp. UCD-THU]|nr:hypothetical protein H490_0111015 [Leucobacter sp. UCD-THU]
MIELVRVHVRRPRHEQLGAPQREGAADLGELDLEAVDHAHSRAAERDRGEGVARAEHLALVAEQVRLADRRQHAAVPIDREVRVEVAVVGGGLDEADEQCRAGLAARGSEIGDPRVVDGEGELGEPLGLIAGEEQFGEDDEVGLALRERRAHAGEVACDVAGERCVLDDGEAEVRGAHGAHILA